MGWTFFIPFILSLFLVACAPEKKPVKEVESRCLIEGFNEASKTPSIGGREWLSVANPARQSTNGGMRNEAGKVSFLNHSRPTNLVPPFCPLKCAKKNCSGVLFAFWRLYASIKNHHKEHEALVREPTIPIFFEIYLFASLQGVV